MPHILIGTMGKKRKLDDEDERRICNKLKATNHFQQMYDEVLSKVKEQSCYKSLKNIGKHEISNVTEVSIQHTEKAQKARLCYSKIKVLTAAVDDVIQDIIDTQVQNASFLNMIKQEVVKYINENQSSILSDDRDVVRDNTESQQEAEENDEDFGKLSKSSFESFFERKISRDTLLDDSSDSVSSVHTSDLSSFDDEIIISSDEETGKKRKRTSLKLIQEEIEKKKMERKYENVPKEKINKNDDDCDAYTSKNDSSNIAHKSLPPRMRKPNAKYASNDIISPLNVKQKYIEKMFMYGNSSSTQDEGRNSVPRKVGRPRKNPPNPTCSV